MTHRLVIAGVPKAGKTTLANSYVRPIARHTDDLMDLEWSEASDEVARWLDASGPWIIEGVAVVRSLRKWLARVHPQQTGTPCDHVIWLDTPRVTLSRGQARMAAGCRTVWREVRPLLLARGVHVEEA